jgi:hypothetical protein
MKHYQKIIVFSVLLIIGYCASASAFPTVKEQNNRIYIQDRPGEKWDVTEAVSIGFDPDKFQYGIGRYAFTPLDDTRLTTDDAFVSLSLRVIGVAGGDEARAYSVPKLSRHEIANSTIADVPIAVGY